MTSFSSSLSNELLQCHICHVCLEVLNDPVTTSCGHNFCNCCIEACWESRPYLCPVCKEEFESKPELKINAAFLKLDRYKLHQQPKKLQHQIKTLHHILCDVCSNNKLRAVKSCLQCVTSFCETHLTNHKTTPKLVRHKLIDPVDNLEDYICEKPDKPREMFCRDDQTCPCLFCTETKHKTHKDVPIKEESGHKKVQLEKTQAEIKVMIHDRSNKITEIKNLVKFNKSTNERNKANKVELFTDLIRSVKRCQSELLEVMEQKQKAAETQAEELIKELEQEITKLKRRNTELEQLSHTEDHLHLLQVYSSVCSPPEVKSWTNININPDIFNTDILDKALNCLKEKVNKQLKNIHDITQPSVVHEINFNPPTSQVSTSKIFEFGSTNTDSAPSHHSLDVKSFSDMQKMDTLKTQKGKISNIKTSNVQTEGKIYFTLGKSDCTLSKKKAKRMDKKVKVTWFGLSLSAIQQLYAVNVILDPNTAYPELILSKNGKQVSHGGSWRDVPNNPERFDSSACVLGKDGFSCGRFYFAVQVSDKTEWDLGVVRESVKRKGKITVCPENGFWCIWLRMGGKYVANESRPVPLSLKDKPQEVGVFVDYEEGLVSFYNVETKALIYSFTGLSFTEKIHPFFSPCNRRGGINVKPLILNTA